MNRVLALKQRTDKLIQTGAAPSTVMAVEIQDIKFLLAENEEIHRRFILLCKKKGIDINELNKFTQAEYDAKHPKKVLTNEPSLNKRNEKEFFI